MSRLTKRGAASGARRNGSLTCCPGFTTGSLEPVSETGTCRERFARTSSEKKGSVVRNIERHKEQPCCDTCGAPEWLHPSIGHQHKFKHGISLCSECGYEWPCAAAYWKTEAEMWRNEAEAWRQTADRVEAMYKKRLAQYERW